mmetsp:Transcript_10180/g.22573  ORF Transcript_10180/g.22573 Transcript_10180/m.22573 type:complete len:201 (+) Transcript_10180:561-1163(+)
MPAALNVRTSPPPLEKPIQSGVMLLASRTASSPSKAPVTILYFFFLKAVFGPALDALSRLAGVLRLRKLFSRGVLSTLLAPGTPISTSAPLTDESGLLLLLPPGEEAICLRVEEAEPGEPLGLLPLLVTTAPLVGRPTPVLLFAAAAALACVLLAFAGAQSAAGMKRKSAQASSMIFRRPASLSSLCACASSAASIYVRK